MNTVLKHDGNKEDFIELFILTYRKSLNMSELLREFWWECQNVEKPYYYLIYEFIFEFLLFRVP